MPFNVTEMPGTRADFRALAIKFDDKLEKAPRTFDDYLAGLLRFKQGARETNRWLPVLREHKPEILAVLAYPNLSGVSPEFASRLSVGDLEDIAAGDIPMRTVQAFEAAYPSGRRRMGL